MIFEGDAVSGTEDHFVDPARVLSLRNAPLLQQCEVHLWAFELQAKDAILLACERLLNASERMRAGRFAFQKHKHRYIVAHGVLRHLLSLYSGGAPRDIGFEHSASGKPRMLLSARSATSVGSVRDDLAFNLSHSHDRALIGVCRGCEIGVDLEMIRPEVDVLSLANSCFFGEEIAMIRAAAGDLQRETFFRYWVAKEAVLKGEGIGLGYPLDRFEVRFMAADESVGSISSSDATQLHADWTVRVLRLAAGWPGAVAARGTGWTVRILRAGAEVPP